MSINTSHSTHYQKRILLLAFAVSVIVHAVVIEFSLHSPSALQANSDNRISVSVHWSPDTASEIKPVKIQAQAIPANSLESAQQTRQKPKSETKVIKSVKKTQDAKVLLTNATAQVKTDIEQAKPINKKPALKSESTHANSANTEIKNNIQKIEKQQLISQTPVEPPKGIEAMEASASSGTNNDMKHQETSRYQLGTSDNPIPNYPPIARKRGWQGQVVLGVYVRADGSIEHLTFVKSTNYGVLNHEAYETVRSSWQFKALEAKDDSDGPMYIEVPFTFNIANR